MKNLYILIIGLVLNFSVYAKTVSGSCNIVIVRNDGRFISIFNAFKFQKLLTASTNEQIPQYVSELLQLETKDKEVEIVSVSDVYEEGRFKGINAKFKNDFSRYVIECKWR
jgi:hypothetical protein